MCNEKAARSASTLSSVTAASTSSSAGGRSRRPNNNSSSRHYQHSPESVLAQCESLWPAWAAAGCRLEALNAAGGAIAGAPRPDQAAAGLRAAADAAARLPAPERELLATDRRVRGLVECLRVTRSRGEEGGGDGEGDGEGRAASSPSSSQLSAEAAPDAAVGLALLGGREGCHDEALAAVLRLAVSGGGEGGGVEDAAAAAASSSPSPPPFDLHPAAAADLLRAMAVARYADRRVLRSLDAVLAAATRENSSSNKSTKSGFSSKGSRGGSGSGTGGKKASSEQQPSPADISAALWAFAVLQHQPEALLAGDDDEEGRRGGEGSPVASLLASAASAAAGGASSSSSGFRSRRDPSISSSSATAATAIIRPRDLASSLWALAALGRVSESKAFRAGWAAALALGRGGMAPAGEAGLSQLHLAGAAANLFSFPAGGGGSAAAAAAPLLRGGWVARPGSLPRVGDPPAAAAAAEAEGEEAGDSSEELSLLSAAAEHAWLRASALRSGAASSKASKPGKNYSSTSSSPSTLQRQVVSSLASILGRGGGVVGEEGVCPVTWLPVDALVPAGRLAKAQRASSGFVSSPSSSTATTAEAGEEAAKLNNSPSPSTSKNPSFPFLGLALEVDGPLHDLRGPDGGPGVPTGGTALKRRLLAAAGWSVVVVGHKEWSEAGSGVAARQMLLRKLEEAGVV